MDQPHLTYTNNVQFKYIVLAPEPPAGLLELLVSPVPFVLPEMVPAPLLASVELPLAASCDASFVRFARKQPTVSLVAELIRANLKYASRLCVV